MKINNNKANDNKRRNRDSEDYAALNNELGSFGLEPPKIYRNEQQRQNSQQKGGRKSAKKKTTQQIKGIRKPLDNNQKIQKRKKKNRVIKCIKALSILLAIIIAVVAIVVLFFKIDKISVEGNSKYTTKEILAVLPIEKEKNMFLIDTSSAGEKLEENLPYVFDVSIKRKLPSTIVVSITETPKIYSVKNKDKTYTLIDENLKVLEANITKKPTDSIEIQRLTLSVNQLGSSAVIEKEQQKNDLLAMMSAISRLELKEATSVMSLDINNNSIEYDNRINIKLGTTENIDNKIYSALTAIEKLNASTPGARGDLTVSNDKQVYFTEKM